MIRILASAKCKVSEQNKVIMMMMVMMVMTIIMIVMTKLIMRAEEALTDAEKTLIFATNRLNVLIILHLCKLPCPHHLQR